MTTTQPIIKLSELTPSKYYQLLKTRLDALEPGEYRAKYNTLKKCITASIRQAGYTKAEAERIAHNYLNTHLGHPYIEEKTSGGLYDVLYLEKQMKAGFYDHSLGVFWKWYQK